jgi:hypothetical protein
MLVEAAQVHDGCSKVGVVPSPHYAPRICNGGMIYINGRLLVGVSFLAHDARYGSPGRFACVDGRPDRRRRACDL